MTQTRPARPITVHPAGAGTGAGRPARSSRSRMTGILAVVCGGVLLASLTACAPGVPLVTGSPTTPPVVAPSAEPTPTTTPTTEPEPEPEPTTTPTPESTPIALSCTDLVPLEVMYNFNPNFGTDPDYAPDAGSAAAQMAAEGGLACGWINQSSSEEIEIAVAHLDDEAMGAAYEKALADSTPVPLFGMEGFFTSQGNVGEAQAFTPEYWLVARSSAFVEASDAQDLVNSALRALPAS